MFRQMFRSTCSMCTAVLAPKAVSNPEVNEGWERLKRMFETDELGTLSPELTSIYQTTFLTGFVGAIYGGVIHSREAYLRFFERNQHTKFLDHFEAKKKLQDFVTVNFVKGAFKWSWRIALFGSLYISVVTVMSTYRGDPSILDFITAGVVSGGLYRINYGLKGVIAGSSLGLMIGMFAGASSTAILKLTDTKLDDVRQFQVELAQFRSKNLAEAGKKPLQEEMKNENLLAVSHDARVTFEESRN